MDSNNSLHDIDEVHYRAPKLWFSSYNYDYERGMITFYFSSTVDPVGATYTTAVHSIEDMEWLNDGYFVVILVGRHRCCSTKFERTNEAWIGLQNHCTCPTLFWIDGKPISPAQAIKVGKTAIISTAIVQREATVTDEMQSLLRHVRAFKEDKTVRFVDRLKKNIVKDLIPQISWLLTLMRPSYATLQLAK